MKNSIIFLFVFFIFSYSLIAQEMKEIDESEDVQLIGGIGFASGYGYMDVSKLHVFVADNINKFSNHHFIVGGTGYAIRKKIVYGISGYAITGDLIDTDSINVSINGGVGTFDFGFLVLDKKKIIMYPMIGIGGSGFGLHIVKNKDVSVSHISNNPDQEIKISKGGFVADISLNLNIIPLRDEKNNLCAGIMTGLKIGYVYSLPSSDWKFSGGDVTGGPNFGLSMFYVKLILGGFGCQKK